MSQAIKCDLCKNTTPDINPKYSRKKRMGWFRFDCDSQGGSETLLDLCEMCWNNLSIIKGDKEDR